MKKFCSACGNQLELSQRFCNECGAVNPFFVTAFTLLSDQSDELEKLRLEKERIDKELAEKEERQQEFVRQEQLRREAEESEKLKLERLEKEKARKEQAELEKMESKLKEELLRVKEETIQHQKETIELVKGVREELIQMEEGNKQLKEEIAKLSKVKQNERTEASSPTSVITSSNKLSKERGMIVSLLVILLGLTSVLAFFYFTSRYDTKQNETTRTPQQEAILKPADVTSTTTDTIQRKDTVVIIPDTLPVQVKEIVPKPEAKVTKPVIESEKPKNDFTLSESKIIKDLVGKKISGCDIVIENASEIELVSNIVLVEKAANGNLKYKFTAIVVQGNDTFTATPYMYYTPAGAFIKMDGTNCE